MGEGRGSCQWFRVWWNQKGYSTHEKELFKLDVLTNFDADRRFDENKCFPNNTHKGMTSQRQIKFLLQIFLFWYIINFTGKLLQGWDKMRSTHNYPDMISIPAVPFFPLHAMCLPLYCTIRNKNHSLHRLKQPWDGGSQCNRFFGWSNLDVKESRLYSRCCQLVQWIKSPFTIQSALVRIRVGWLFFCFVL